jgi:uncharacterized protein (DUF4415 family)
MAKLRKPGRPVKQGKKIKLHITIDEDVFEGIKDLDNKSYYINNALRKYKERR